MPSLRTYSGRRTHAGVEILVTDDRGEAKPLNPRTDIRNHGPGLEWGYMGSGPAQLALAIIADHVAHRPADMVLLRQIAGLPDVCANCNDRGKTPGGDRCIDCSEPWGEGYPKGLISGAHQPFKEMVIAPLDQNKAWSMTSEAVHLMLVALATRRRVKALGAGDAGAQA